MDNSDLAKRMKTYYEAIPQIKLMRRTPVAIRLDGRSFHTFTRGFQKPFDEVLGRAIRETMKYLCENIQSCILGYQQSDEITLILIDYKNLESEAFFDYEVQKLCSITASMATMAFNKFFIKEVEEWFSSQRPFTTETIRLYDLYHLKSETGAMFDSRCFNIPKEEVANLIYWRQLDATRNSIQMVGQYYFSHKELQGKSCNQIQEMLLIQKDFNWNNMVAYLKRGCCCIKNKIICEPSGNKLINNEVEENRWFVDLDIPIFKGDGRKYIEDLVYIGE